LASLQKLHKTAARISRRCSESTRSKAGGWKKQALAGLPDIFGNGREQMRPQSATEKDERYKQSAGSKWSRTISRKSWPPAAADARKIHPNTKLLCQRVIFEFAVNWAAGQGKGLLAVELEWLARPRRRTLDSLSPHWCNPDPRTDL